MYMVRRRSCKIGWKEIKRNYEKEEKSPGDFIFEYEFKDEEDDEWFSS